MKISGSNPAEASQRLGSATPPERRRVLIPYVEALRAWHSVQAQNAEPETALALELGGQPFEIGSWERAQLQLFFEQKGTAEPREQILGLSIALVTKCAMDLEHFDPTERGDGWYEKQAQLMIDQDLGRGLVADVERWIEESVATGQARRANRLNLLRHRLARAVADVHRALAESEGQLAETIEVLEADRPPLVERAPLPAKAKSVAPVAKARPRPKPAPPARCVGVATGRKGRLLVLAALAAVWFAVSWLPDLLRHEPITISAAEVASPELYLALESRHPSLFVTVDAAAWAALSVEQRRERVELLSSILRRRGYSGALLSARDGRPLARWLTARGTELIAD